MARLNSFWLKLLASEKNKNTTKGVQKMVSKSMKIWMRNKLMQDSPNSGPHSEVDVELVEEEEVVAVMTIIMVILREIIVTENLKILLVVKEEVAGAATLPNQAKEKDLLTM